MIDTGDKTAKATPFGWGILGSGQTAGQFAADLALVPGASLVGNFSRTTANAKRFQENFGSKRAYSDIDAFVADPEIDAVYIATPNSVHVAQALKSIRSGKAILTEKPLAPSHTGSLRHRTGSHPRRCIRHGSDGDKNSCQQSRPQKPKWMPEKSEQSAKLPPNWPMNIHMIPRRAISADHWAAVPVGISGSRVFPWQCFSLVNHKRFRGCGMRPQTAST